MSFDAIPLVSLKTLGVLERKCRRVFKSTILGESEIATIGSRVKFIDCADSQIHQFRLVESTGGKRLNPQDLSIDSSLGLALFGSRLGDYIKLNLGGEEGGIVVLSIDKKF